MCQRRRRLWLAAGCACPLLTFGWAPGGAAMLCRHDHYAKYNIMSAVDESTDVFDEDEDNNEDEDNKLTVKPYRNRSLAWTKRYRRLNPYERVRQRVISFGHRSKSDWDEAVSSGQLGQYVPSHPDEMYAPEWISWDEWLGIMRSYDDAKHLARNILGLKTLDEYILFVRGDNKRAEGLRIPVRPDIFYKDEWIDEDTFFGTS